MSQRASATVAIAAAAVLLGSSVPVARAQECYADCDGNGELDFFDFLCYQNLFAAGDPRADCDGSGELDFFDFLCFQNAFAAGCPSVATATELACIALDGYPHVAFVQAFGPAEPVLIAVDPTVHTIGGPADVYITASKDAAGWAADPQLLDVRPGGPQAVDFRGGSDVRDNTFELAGSEALVSDAGERIGVGYDVVVDVNRNGVLDGGDLIDGLGVGDSPGFVKFKDLTSPGPATVTRIDTYAVQFLGIPVSSNQQRLSYPADIASRSDVPVIIIAHGNGQDYRWYDYIHDLFASQGWAVVSIQTNQTTSSEEQHAERILRHTDAFFASLDTIAGGALAGRIDPSRTVWIGHSRGGEGVVRAVTRILTGVYTPINYTLDDIALVSAIAPSVFLGTEMSTPRHVRYHHIAGAGDGDITGSPAHTVTQHFAIYERAEGPRFSTYIHGAGHNDFNCCGPADYTGPPELRIGRDEAQQVAKVVWRALIEDAVYGSPAALEFLQRPWARMRPAGVSAATTVVLESRISVAPDARFVVDDFQRNPSPSLSSSGGAVTWSVSSLLEDRLDDADTSLTWTPLDPMNGMTRANNPADTTRGIVFDYRDDSFLEFEVVEASRDFTRWRFLSWRACQQTRHPDTLAYQDDQVYEVTLRDGAGRSSTVRIDAWGAGHTQPFARSGAGDGVGWINAFQTVRIDVRDFARNGGGGIDLADIRAVRFEFGPAHGTPAGRLGFDDIELTAD